MSGGGGGSGNWREEPKAPVAPATGAAGVGGVAGTDPCIITEITNLNSLNASALRAVRTGYLLEVVFLPGPPRLVAQDLSGATVGSITSPSMLQLIKCIQDGRKYVAEVLSVNGGSCNVKVRLK